MKIQQKGTLIFVSVILLLYILSQQFSIPSITENQSKDTKNIKEIDEKNPKTAIALNWSETWDIGLNNYGDYGNGIATDSEGNLYIAGLSEKILPFDWYAFLIKYDSKGNYLWNKTWYTGSAAQAWAITNDTSDNIYVAGFTSFGSNVIKFNSTGDVQWNETYSESSILDGIIYCSDGFIYATGAKPEVFIRTNITLLKINSTTGQLDKIASYESKNTGIITVTSGWDIAIDSFNYIYVTGINETYSDADIILLKYDNSCNLIWNITWNNPFGTTHNERGYGLTIDSQDNIYVTGYNQTGNDYDIILLKYDNESNLLWQKSWDNSNGRDRAWGIDIDSEDSIYIIGYEQNSTGHNNSILIKFDDDGIQIWNQSWGFIEDDEGRGLLVIDSEKIIITGATESYAKGDKPDMFIAYFHISGKDVTPPIINFENNEKYLNNTSPSDTDLNLMINCTVSDTSDLFWVYLCENSTGAFVNRSMTLGPDGNWTYILDISALNANDILMFLFYANDSWGNIACLDNGGLNYTITITSTGDGGGVLPGDDDDDDDDEEAAIPFGNNYIIFTVITVISLIVIMKRKAILKKQ